MIKYYVCTTAQTHHHINTRPKCSQNNSTGRLFFRFCACARLYEHNADITGTHYIEHYSRWTGEAEKYIRTWPSSLRMCLEHICHTHACCVYLSVCSAALLWPNKNTVMNISSYVWEYDVLYWVYFHVRWHIWLYGARQQSISYALYMFYIWYMVWQVLLCYIICGTPQARTHYQSSLLFACCCAAQQHFIMSHKCTSITVSCGRKHLYTHISYYMRNSVSAWVCTSVTVFDHFSTWLQHHRHSQRASFCHHVSGRHTFAFT